MSLLIDLQYFPSIYYLKLLSKEQIVEIEAFETFQKMSFRNRCAVLGAQGPIPLTIPVLGGRNLNAMIQDVEIDNRQNWQTQHLRTISSCYRRAPFFEHYFDVVSSLINCSTNSLWEFNNNILNWLVKTLQIDASIKPTVGFEKQITDTGKLDMRGKILPRNFGEYLVPNYIQNFEQRDGFVSNLSILDGLFCAGPSILKGW
jgi:hypothetical protein